MAGEKKTISLKGKILLLVLVAMVFAMAVFGSAFMPSLGTRTYQSMMIIQIGQLDGKVIESPEDLCVLLNHKAYLASLLRIHERGLTESDVQGVEFFTRGAKTLLFVSGSAQDPARVTSILGIIKDAILERHNQIYTRARAEVAERAKEIESTEKRLFEKIGVATSSADDVLLKISLYQTLADLHKQRIRLSNFDTAPSVLVSGPDRPQESNDRSRVIFAAFVLSALGAMAIAWAMRSAYRKTNGTSL